MTKRTITGLYDTYDEASRTVKDLEAADVPRDDISIVASNADNQVESSAAGHDAAIGATAGGVVGGGAGLLAGLGLFAIPGVGPVVAAGWLAALAVGAAAGAAAGGVGGGIIGSLTGSGVSSDDAHVYAEGVRRGGSLVTVRVDENRTGVVELIMQRHRRVDVNQRGASYREAGWNSFDEKAAPFTQEEVSRERSQYR